MELKRVEVLVIGLVFGAMLASCAGVAFPYHYFGLAAATYNGSLVGPEPADDLPLSDCQPTKYDARPCLVMKTSEFLAMKQDYLDTKNQLVACQKGAP